MNRVYLALSAFVGAVLCILADLSQKSEASAVVNIGNSLGGIFNIPAPSIVAIFIILVLGISLCFIFDIPNKKSAFYIGGSVLAIMMTLVPYKMPSGFKTQPNSVKVILQINTPNNQPASATITLWARDGRTILARTRTSGRQFEFYQDGGQYKLSVEAPGYLIVFTDLILREGQQPAKIKVTLQPSGIPLNIQRLQR